MFQEICMFCEVWVIKNQERNFYCKIGNGVHRVGLYT